MKSTALHAPDQARLQSLHFQPDAESGVRIFNGPLPDYFATFGLEPRIHLDAAALRETFLELSRRFHPDFHSGASEALRAEVLRRSSLINNAHRTLRDLPKRADYLIQLLAPGIESNRNAVPPELLEEMFDIQEAGEALKEARVAADGAALEAAEKMIAPLREQVRATRTAVEAGLDAQGAALDELLDGGHAPSDEKVVAALKGIRLSLDRLNYLRTVLRNLH
ncbi:hypothetical protein GC173_17040 [bacterium]|nr:hypothetical protein [bacterium]